MNERIEKLAEQSVSRFDKDMDGSMEPTENGRWVYYDDLTEFAELIVGECIQACINEGKTFEVESAGEYSSNLYATAIKKHFGVEE